jgi:hypothetical protein
MQSYLALSTRKDIIEAIEKHYLNGKKVTDLKQKVGCLVSRKTYMVWCI